MFALFWGYRKTGALPAAATIPRTRTAVPTGRTLGLRHDEQGEARQPHRRRADDQRQCQYRADRLNRSERDATRDLRGWHFATNQTLLAFGHYRTNNGHRAAPGAGCLGRDDPCETSASISCCSSEAAFSP